LRRQVRDSAGLSPKTYARVLRLAHTMQVADRSPHPDWAGIAAGSGYCDQSHLIRECLALAGAAPTQIHAERGRQLVAVAEKSNPSWHPRRDTQPWLPEFSRPSRSR
jgi:AraC-like DNA-binding protein